MITLLLIIIPLLTGLLLFFTRQERLAKMLGLAGMLITLCTAASAYLWPGSEINNHFEGQWLNLLRSSFSLSMDGMSQLLCLLNALAYPLVMIAVWNKEHKRSNQFWGLMLLAQAGMMGVFLAADALLFYFFWELALIPMYFLCSLWGGEKRIAATFKFFIYTFVGSLLMLIGIIYLQSKTPLSNFSLEAFQNIQLTVRQQQWIFWLFFIAFAIKMPVFPFHTWQPEIYSQAPTAGTMILSGVMVKMGLFGMLRWLFPVLPLASFQWADFITPLALAGGIYASLIAIRQDNLKKLVAYSSIAHIGLMCAASFAQNETGLQGVMIQMFHHGINIIGLWIVVEVIERKCGTVKISELGGLAQKAPTLALMLVLVALANIALPLTNAFPGEFLMFTGIFNSATKYHVWFIIMAGLGIILGAIYTLNMIRKVFFGEPVAATAQMTDINRVEKLSLGIIVLIIFVAGIYPQWMLDQTAGVSAGMNKEFESIILNLQKK